MACASSLSRSGAIDSTRQPRTSSTGWARAGAMVIATRSAPIAAARFQSRGPFMSSPLHHPHHAPAQYGGLLDRTEHQALEREADRADHDQRGEHQGGVEELLGVEDHP